MKLSLNNKYNKYISVKLNPDLRKYLLRLYLYFNSKTHEGISGGNYQLLKAGGAELFAHCAERTPVIQLVHFNHLHNVQTGYPIIYTTCMYQSFAHRAEIEYVPNNIRADN